MHAQRIVDPQHQTSRLFSQRLSGGTTRVILCSKILNLFVFQHLSFAVNFV